jgi:predicted small integral membrane protein
MPVTTMGSWLRKVARLRRGATMWEEAAVVGGGRVGKLRLAVARGWGVCQREE